LRHKRQPILMPMIRIVTDLVPSQVLTRSSHQSSLSLALSIFIHPSLVFMSVPKSSTLVRALLVPHRGFDVRLAAWLGHPQAGRRRGARNPLDRAPVRADEARSLFRLLARPSPHLPPNRHPCPRPTAASTSRTPLSFRQQGVREREYAIGSASSSSVVVVDRRWSIGRRLARSHPSDEYVRVVRAPTLSPTRS